MKKRILFLLILLLLIQTSVIGQPCLPLGIEFTNQEQIDSFQVNYPACTEIEGTVKICGIDISNLTGLSSLTRIGGDLIIGDHLSYEPFYNKNLVDLSGLHNVDTIAGSLVIQYNSMLMSVDGLDKLNFIGGDLLLNRNDTLSSLSALNNLKKIDGPLVITENRSLGSLSGLDSLQMTGGFTSYWNTSLSDFTGLESLDTIMGELKIGMWWDWEFPSLKSLSGLDNLKYVGGDLNIWSCDSLMDLLPLSSAFT